MQSLDLFHQHPEAHEQCHEAIIMRGESAEERARSVIMEIMKAGHICTGAYSSGKDSSALTSIMFLCAVQLKRLGIRPPPIVIMHSQTGVENPEVSRLALAEIEKMKVFAARHDLELHVLVGFPELNDSWPVRVIGGRALPSFATTRADCSVDFKSKVNERQLSLLMRTAPSLGDWLAPVVMTGVRLSESTVRDARIARRGEKEGIWVNDFGHLRASPLLHHSVDDVWEHLGLCAAGVYESYSDFAETMDLYKAAGGSSCVIVADMKMSGSSKPCGARTGCWACTRIGPRDRSAEQMIESDWKRYGYMKPLSRLRSWIANTQYDWGLRQFVGRTISRDGHIEVGADTYSPDTLRKLLVYTLTAERLSGVPIISIEQLVAIDARWSQYAIAPPFTAVKIYLDLERYGGWEEAPQAPLHPPTIAPKIGRLHVGTNWYEATGVTSMAGLRDAGMEMFHESCGRGIKVLSNGALVCDYEDADSFTVDAEGAADFLTFLADEYIDQYCRDDCADWTFGYKTYLRLGTIAYGAGQSRSSDEILRRSQWRQEHKLHGQRSVEELRRRCSQLYEAQLELL
ncbi:hypothetical protein [Paracidovorax citrulli]|uniref:hypothetical protein n=1 Tax=Paracidovorax citrulli TaxID=80869 RepID=UPI003FA689B4